MTISATDPVEWLKILKVAFWATNLNQAEMAFKMEKNKMSSVDRD